MGTLLERTLPAEFYEQFQLFSSDLYWVCNAGQCDVVNVTLTDILSDIKSTIELLRIAPCVILAHSAFGIVALEFAKKYPHLVAGIIMIGTPVNSNQTAAQQHDALFLQQADAQRKQIDAQRRAQVAKEDLDTLSSSDRF